MSDPQTNKAPQLEANMIQFNERKDHFRRSEEFDLINSINRSCSMKADKANLKLRVKFL